MQVNQSRFFRLIMAIVSIVSLMTISSAYAASRCGSFEMVDMPVRASHFVSFDDGTATMVGPSNDNPAIPVLRYFDGSFWNEQSLPSELSGFAFSSAGTTPGGEAWFTGTRAYSVYEIEVVFMRVNGGIIDRIDYDFSSFGAPIDISASSSDDVWALTSAGDIFHFDGSSWTSTDIPPVFLDQHLNPKSIYAVSPHNVWLAGYGSVGKMADQGFVQHWDGSSWSVVSTPYDGQTTSHFFNDMDGSSADDIWVVGYGYGSAGTEGILMHWDGSSWTKKANQAGSILMARVMAMAPGNAWAIPVQGNSLYYWNGNIWSEAGGLNFPDSAVSISLRDVSKSSPCDAWIVGDYHNGTAYQPWAARLIAGEVGAEVFVSGLTVSRVRVSIRSFYAVAVVTVLNGDMQPVSGAVVKGNFSGPTNEQREVTTGSDGKAVLTTETVVKPDGNWCFTVSDVVASGAIYQEAMNSVTSVCEGGNDGSNSGRKDNKNKR